MRYIIIFLLIPFLSGAQKATFVGYLDTVPIGLFFDLSFMSELMINTETSTVWVFDRSDSTWYQLASNDAVNFNLYNQSDTLTSNRTLDGQNFTLLFDSLGNFTVRTINGDIDLSTRGENQDVKIYANKGTGDVIIESVQMWKDAAGGVYSLPAGTYIPTWDEAGSFVEWKAINDFLGTTYSDTSFVVYDTTDLSGIWRTGPTQWTLGGSNDTSRLTFMDSGTTDFNQVGIGSHGDSLMLRSEGSDFYLTDIIGGSDLVDNGTTLTADFGDKRKGRVVQIDLNTAGSATVNLNNLYDGEIYTAHVYNGSNTDVTLSSNETVTNYKYDDGTNITFPVSIVTGTLITFYYDQTDSEIWTTLNP